MGIEMAHFRVTHSAFHDIHAQIDLPANSLVMNGEARAADLIRRLTISGAADARAVDLTPAEHRAIVLAQFPQLVGG